MKSVKDEVLDDPSYINGIQILYLYATDQVVDQIRDQVWNKIWDQVWRQISFQVRYQLIDKILEFDQ